MRLKEIQIQNYRSIENVTIKFPPDLPVILFGQNNAGKSNILSAINLFLGEKYPLYRDITDTDYKQGSKSPIDIVGTFDESLPGVCPFFPRSMNTAKFEKTGSSEVLTCTPIYDTNPLNHNGFPMQNIEISKIGLKYIRYQKAKSSDLKEHYIFAPERYFYSPTLKDIMLDVDENVWRDFSSLMIEAEDDLSSVLNHENPNSIIRRLFSRLFPSSSGMPNLLKEQLDKVKDGKDLEGAACILRSSLSLANNSIEGFSKIDFALYNPSDISDAIHFVTADEKESIYNLGTGEQQIIALSLITTYMAAACGFRILILDEPETHLHPLAQKWLKEFIKTRSANAIDERNNMLQIIIATHSPYFLDPDFIEGFVHVYKEHGLTYCKQLSEEKLCDITNKQHAELVGKVCTMFTDEQLKGFFAEIILLVEGASEAEALPIWLGKQDFPLYKHGIEIIHCDGKGSIKFFYKIFSAYGYKCYAIFDHDIGNTQEGNNNTDLLSLCQYSGPTDFKDKSYHVGKSCAFFEKDFDCYLHDYLIDAVGREENKKILQKLIEIYNPKPKWHWNWEKNGKELKSGDDLGSKPQFERALAIYLTKSENQFYTKITIPFVEELKTQLRSIEQALR